MLINKILATTIALTLISLLIVQIIFASPSVQDSSEATATITPTPVLDGSDESIEDEILRLIEEELSRNRPADSDSDNDTSSDSGGAPKPQRSERSCPVRAKHDDAVSFKDDSFVWGYAIYFNESDYTKVKEDHTVTIAGPSSVQSLIYFGESHGSLNFVANRYGPYFNDLGSYIWVAYWVHDQRLEKDPRPFSGFIDSTRSVRIDVSGCQSASGSRRISSGVKHYSPQPTPTPTAEMKSTPIANRTPNPTPEPTAIPTQTPRISVPPSPTDLTYRQINYTTANLTWDSASGVSKHRVERSANGVSGWSEVAESYDASYRDDSLTCGATYYFRVSAFGDGTSYKSVWSAPSVPFALATVCEPTAYSLGDTGDKVVAKYDISDASSFHYTLKLTWAVRNSVHQIEVDISRSSDSYTFTNLSQSLEDGKWYQVSLKLCQDSAGRDCPSSVSSVPIYYVNKNRIGDNVSDEIIIQKTASTTRARFDIGIDATRKRAYLVKVKPVSGDVSASELSVDRASEREEPPDYQYLGRGQVVWIEDLSRDLRRNLMLDVKSPKETAFQITISKPDYAFVEPIFRDLDEKRDRYVRDRLKLSSWIYNSSDKEPEVLVYEVYCMNPEAEDAMSSSVGDIVQELKPGKSLKLNVTTVCQGVDLTSDQFDVFMYMGGKNSCGLNLRCPSPSEHTIADSMDVNWNVSMDTVWNPHTPIVGGIQMFAQSNSDGLAGICTLSFPLTLVRIKDGKKFNSISSTGHCVAEDHEWLQGPFPMVDGNSDVNTLGKTFLPRPSTAPCDINTSYDTTTKQLYAERKTNCYSGDHSYATTTLPISADIFRPSSKRRGGDPVKFDHFVEAKSGDALRIVSSRPPVNDELVDKVGRTTGWSSGKLIWSDPQGDPSCPGSELGLEDNQTIAYDTYFECLTHSAYTSSGGDSGAPVFVGESGSGITLVGVHYGSRYKDGISISRRFIPIDRIYAESLKDGYDWLPVELKVVPALNDPNIESISYKKEDDKTYIVAKFDAKDFGSPVLHYQAALFREGVKMSGVEEVSLFTHGTVTYKNMSYPTRYAMFDVSDLSNALKYGIFRVAVRACTDSSLKTCGDYGSRGKSQYLTPP